ncbi:MAG: penicillin-binding protein [Patescibacteria group bacterium]
MIFVYMGRKKSFFHSHTARAWVFIAAIAFFMCGGAILLWTASLRVPDFSSFEERKIAQSTKIYDRTGEVLLYDINRDIKRTVVQFDNISAYAKDAAVAIEDAEFYSHKGVRPLAIARAIFVNILHLGFSQGGSTITQQVVKNTLLTQEKTVSRKLKEWVLAIKLEQMMSKDEILALYLNEAPYGGSIYGIGEASREFFGKTPDTISLAESAYLAALPQAPTFYSPYGNNRDKLDERKDLVLKRMLEQKHITDGEYSSARKEDTVFLPQQKSGIRAPHFVFYVRSYLEEKYGKDIVEQGGLKVITTIDAALQQKAEEVVKTYALENAEKFNAENAALVATDPKTGNILVMVGSRDYFDKEIDGNFNVAISHRQPGSAFKPFVYATAFKKGYTPDTVVFDVQTEFQTTCGVDGRPLSSETNPEDCYMPVNYDGKYQGPISLRNALAQSVNIPAIKTLYLSGLKDSLQTAKDFGITSLTNINQYGLTLVLGGGEVSLLELTNAYGVFANEGIKNAPASILRVEDASGNVLEEFSPRPQTIISAEITRQISSILSDNEARTPAFGASSYLYFPGKDVAVKTGTTNDYRDAWIIGYTPSLVAGAWAGNNDNTPMEKKVAGFIIAPLWNAFMQEALKTVPKETFREPTRVREDIKPILRGLWQGDDSFVIDTISGKLATEYTPQETRKEIAVGAVHNILHFVDKKDPLGAPPANPEEDPQYRLWEYPVQKWLTEHGVSGSSVQNKPSSYDDVHTPSNIPSISITSPTNGALLPLNNRVLVMIQTSGKYPAARADYFVNGVAVGSTKIFPFSFSFTPYDTSSIQDNNTLGVVVYDSVFNRNETSISFTVSR